MGKYSYVGNIYLPTPLSPEDEHEALIRLKVDKDLTAEEILVEHNLRLVKYIVKNFQNTGLDEDELFAVGTKGLMKGVRTYDMSKNTKLATYITRCINNEILMYMRRSQKWALDISIETVLSTDYEGNELTYSSVLPDHKAEDALHKMEEMEYASNIMSIVLSSLTNKKLLIALYTLAEMKQEEIGEHLSISQSYVSRLQTDFRTKLKKIHQISDKMLRQQYTLSQSNTQDFIFFLDNRNRFCLSCHSKFSKSFLEFIKPYNIEFETANDTGRMIIRLPIDESSYIFCAELIAYISKPSHN